MTTYYASGATSNTASNWGLTSGASDGAVPTSTDLAIFDANSISMAIDANFNVLGIDTTGFTNTLTQNAGITITVGANGWQHVAGTFAGGDSLIDINGDSDISGGVFTSTSGELKIDDVDYNHSGGTFNHGSGSVRQYQNTNATRLLNGGFTFYKFHIDHDTGAGSHDVFLTIDTDITIENLFTFEPRTVGGWGTVINSVPTFFCKGDYQGIGIGCESNVNITFDGASGDQTITDFGWGQGIVTVNKALNDVVFTGSFVLGSNAISSTLCTIDFQTTVDFTTNSVLANMVISNGVDVTITVGNSFAFHNLQYGGGGSGGGVLSLGAGNVITVKGNLTGNLDIGGGHGRKMNDGTLEVEGNIDMTIALNGSNSKGTTLIKLIGTVSSTIRTSTTTSYFNDILVAKTAPAVVTVLDRFANFSGVFEPSNQFDNDSGTGSIYTGTFLLETGITVVAQVVPIFGDTFIQNGGTFTGNGAKHIFDQWAMNGGVHTVLDVGCNRSYYRIEPACTYTMQTNGNLDADSGETVGFALDLNSNAIHHFQFSRSAFGLTFESAGDIEGDVNLKGTGFTLSSSSLTMNLRGDILEYTRSVAQANNLIFLMNETYDQNIHYSDESISTHDGFTSLDLRANGGRQIFLTSVSNDFPITRDFKSDLGTNLILQSNLRLWARATRTSVIATDTQWYSVYFNKGAWGLFLESDLHVNHFKFLPRTGSTPSISNSGTGADVYIYESFLVNGNISISADISVNSPSYRFVGDKDATIQSTSSNKTVIEGLYFINKDAGVVKLLDDSNFDDDNLYNAGDYDFTITKGILCTNGFDMVVDGDLLVDTLGVIQKVSPTVLTVTGSTTINGAIVDVQGCNSGVVV